jgi:hypothetical protein
VVSQHIWISTDKLNVQSFTFGHDKVAARGMVVFAGAKGEMSFVVMVQKVQVVGANNDFNNFYNDFNFIFSSNDHLYF